MSLINAHLPSIDTLIAPIKDSRHGVGEDLTFDPRLEAIVAARLEDDSLLAQGNWITELKVADWNYVKSECETLLLKTSKDLKLALWYTDALSHTDHLAGINHGLALLLALNDDYWLTMFPPLDGEEDSMDIRAGLYSWFVKALTDDLYQLQLSDNDAGVYNYNYYITAREHDKQRQQNPDSVIKGQLNLSDYHQAIKNSQPDWQQMLMTELKVTAQRWQALTDQLNDLMGIDAPVCAPVTDLLETLTQHLRPLIPQHIEAIVGSGPSEADKSSKGRDTESNEPLSLASTQAHAQASGQTSFAPKTQGHQANRRQALRLLGQIQDYFAANEPHSPVTYLLARAIDWADMPLDQWLARVIKSEDELALLSDMIGIKPGTDNNTDDEY